MNMVIAIDPGKAGGLAVFGAGKPFAYAMPDTAGDLLDLLRELHQSATIEAREPVCVLELVGGFVGKKQPGSAMFKFGEGYGFIKGVIQTLGIPLELVRPQDWQKVFHLGTSASCGGGKVWKNKLKAEAQRRFPHLKVTLATADALLLGTYFLNSSKQNTVAPCGGELASLLGGVTARR